MASDHPIGKPFTVLDVVSSTNNYAMAQVQAQMAAHGATWFAMYQSEGKGQRGKSWRAEPGQNIMQSIIIEPDFLKIDNQFLLTVVVSLACYDFFVKYAIDQVTIKWANDIYWRDRKAGGILIENILQGKEWKYAVVGIGFNINQAHFPKELPNPVSLRQITGNVIPVTEAGKELCQFIEKRWQQLKLGMEEQLLEEYNSHLFKLNEQVQLKMNGAIIKARVTGVNKQGQLLIYTGEQMAINFGAVEWVLDHESNVG